MKDSFAAALFVLILVMGLSAGWLGGNMNQTVRTVTDTATQPSAASDNAKTVNLDIVPDWGGGTYDAFVISSHENGTVPQAATNTTGPGPNDNNITVTAGVPITFVITNIDTALLVNFTGPVSTDFTVYNDTASGVIASHYSKGQSLSSLPTSHTFTITSLDLNIPIPPDTVVTFTYTFSNPGVYEYQCETPCGPGMDLAGYMIGYMIVTSS